MSGAAVIRRGILSGPVRGAAAGNGPMTALRITDPRSWDANSWVTDLVPHLAYGVVTAYMLGGLAAD